MDANELALNSAVLALGVGLIVGAVAVGVWVNWCDSREQIQRWLP